MGGFLLKNGKSVIEYPRAKEVSAYGGLFNNDARSVLLVADIGR